MKGRKMLRAFGVVLLLNLVAACAGGQRTCYEVRQVETAELSAKYLKAVPCQDESQE